MKQEIIVYEKYPEYYETKIDGMIIRSPRIGIIMETVKELVGDCVIKVSRCATIEDYERLKSTGMMYELFPEATGIYEKDKHLIYKK